MAKYYLKDILNENLFKDLKTFKTFLSKDEIDTLESDFKENSTFKSYK